MVLRNDKNDIDDRKHQEALPPKYKMLSSREGSSLDSTEERSKSSKFGYWLLVIGVVGLRFPFGGYLAITGPTLLHLSGQGSIDQTIWPILYGKRLRPSVDPYFRKCGKRFRYNSMGFYRLFDKLYIGLDYNWIYISENYKIRSKNYCDGGTVGPCREYLDFGTGSH